ncbi:MAG: hypothetical protein Q7T73_03395 [Beijerinckiaceae bacterium]|nr:hypothetical protein [Beijerinckiaceae bacterium]
MTREFQAVTAVGLLLLFGCGAPRPEVGGAAAPISKTTAPPSQAATPSPSATTDITRDPSPAPGTGKNDTALVRNFLEFAAEPSEQTAAPLQFAPDVRLGLGRDLVVTVRGDEVQGAAKWVLDVDYFRAYNGPFSALQTVRTRLGATQPKPGDKASLLQVSVGEHPRCAGPSEAPPDGLRVLRRVSLQPSAATMDSCLSWFSVDFFLNQDRRLEAVTLDIWEP